MSGHIIPVIVSWHVGTRVNEVAKHATGATTTGCLRGLGPRSRNVARHLRPAWSFWKAADHDLEDIRSAYAIAPLEPAFEPSGAVPRPATSTAPHGTTDYRDPGARQRWPVPPGGAASAVWR